jgi:PTS system N-acetylgalactosamine-specific IIA component
MISIILTGHGSFAEGLLSAARLITGVCDGVLCVTFPEDDSTENLHIKLKAAIDQSEGDVLILADVAGGSPVKEAVVLRAAMPERRIEVLSGSNVPLVITAVLERDRETLDSLVPRLLEGAKLAIRQYIPAPVQSWENDHEDGI